MDPNSPIPFPPGARTALLVVDMQAFFFRFPERRAGLETVVGNINRMIDFFDAAGMPVFQVITAYKIDGSDWDLKMKMCGKGELISGSAEAEILPEIHRLAGHHMLIKTRYSAFFRTGLAERLLALDVKRVMVMGAYTHYCVNETVFDAYENDFIPGAISDAVISHFPDEAAMMLRRMRRNGYHVLTAAEYIEQNSLLKVTPAPSSARPG